MSTKNNPPCDLSSSPDDMNLPPTASSVPRIYWQRFSPGPSSRELSQSSLTIPGHILQKPSLARILNWFRQNSPLSASHHAHHLIGLLIACIPQVMSEHPGLPSARVLLGYLSQSTLPQTPNVSAWWFFHPLTYSTLPCGNKFPLFLVALWIEPSLSPYCKIPLKSSLNKDCLFLKKCHE